MEADDCFGKFQKNVFNHPRTTIVRQTYRRIKINNEYEIFEGFIVTSLLIYKMRFYVGVKATNEEYDQYFQQHEHFLYKSCQDFFTLNNKEFQRVRNNLLNDIVYNSKFIDENFPNFVKFRKYVDCFPRFFKYNSRYVNNDFNFFCTAFNCLPDYKINFQVTFHDLNNSEFIENIDNFIYDLPIIQNNVEITGFRVLDGQTIEIRGSLKQNYVNRNQMVFRKYLLYHSKSNLGKNVPGAARTVGKLVSRASSAMMGWFDPYYSIDRKSYMTITEESTETNIVTVINHSNGLTLFFQNLKKIKQDTIHLDSQSTEVIDLNQKRYDNDNNNNNNTINIISIQPKYNDFNSHNSLRINNHIRETINYLKNEGWNIEMVINANGTGTLNINNQIFENLNIIPLKRYLNGIRNIVQIDPRQSIFQNRDFIFTCMVFEQRLTFRSSPDDLVNIFHLISINDVIFNLDLSYELVNYFIKLLQLEGLLRRVTEIIQTSFNNNNFHIDFIYENIRHHIRVPIPQFSAIYSFILEEGERFLKFATTCMLYGFVQKILIERNPEWIFRYKNQLTVDTIAPDSQRFGSVLSVERAFGLYKHFGVYISDENEISEERQSIIHVQTRHCGGLALSRSKISTFLNQSILVEAHEFVYSLNRQEIFERIEQLESNRKFRYDNFDNFISKNCEHVAEYIAYGHAFDEETNWKIPVERRSLVFPLVEVTIPSYNEI